MPSRGTIGISPAATRTMPLACPGQELHPLHLLVDHPNLRQRRQIRAAQEARAVRGRVEPFLVERAVVVADQRTVIQKPPEPASCQPAREHDQGACRMTMARTTKTMMWYFRMFSDEPRWTIS